MKKMSYSVAKAFFLLFMVGVALLAGFLTYLVAAPSYLSIQLFVVIFLCNQDFLELEIIVFKVFDLFV